MPRSVAMVSAWLVAAAVFLVLTIYYAVSNHAKTYLISGTSGHHTKHAILFAVLTLVCLVAASMSRPRNVTTV